MTFGIRTIKHAAHSLFANLVFFLKHRKLRAAPEVKAARTSTCESCVFYDPEGKQCLECTCFVEWKSGFAAEDCPHGFW